MTGYSRSEVVPRNCRFLQGNYTDRNATRRLKASIEAREETVELLLNYKKNGEPFWNLLYVGKAFSSEMSLPCRSKTLTATQPLCLTRVAAWPSSLADRSIVPRPFAATPMFYEFFPSLTIRMKMSRPKGRSMTSSHPSGASSALARKKTTHKCLQVPSG